MNRNTEYRTQEGEIKEYKGRIQNTGHRRRRHEEKTQDTRHET